MKRFRFQKLPRKLLAPMRPRQLFTLVAEEIGRQVENATGVDAERIESAPFSGQVVYWLWRFSCEAGVCGLDVFLLNDLGIYAPQIHDALEVIGAKELVRRIEAAIPWALRSCAEFKLLKDRSWFEQFEPIPEFPSLTSVNKGVYAFVRAIRQPTEAFIITNAEELFSPE